MTEVDLQRVRHKAEKGERLSDSELELLQQAAKHSSNVGLRTAAARALLDAHQEWKALSILETLRREFPREVRVRLLQARAFQALKRYAEAERAWNDVLSLHPQATEALKQLAATALRRAEIDLAREWIEELMRVDPSDSETLALHARWAKMDKAPLARPVSQDTYVEALLSRLRQQSTPHLLQKEALLVRLGKGSVARIDLSELHQAYVEDKLPLAKSIEWVAQELAESSLGDLPGREALLASALPVLRPSSFVAWAQGAASREGPGELSVYYVLDDLELVRYVPTNTLSLHQVTLDEFDHAAWKNLEKKTAHPRSVMFQNGHLVLSPSVTGLWALAEGDGHDAARLLTLAQREPLKKMGPGPYRVFLGMRELVVLCQESRQDLTKLLEALEPSADGIPGTFVMDRDFRLVTTPGAP